MTLILEDRVKFLKDKKFHYYDYEHPFFPDTYGIMIKLTSEALKHPDLVREYEEYVGTLMHCRVKLSEDGSELRIVAGSWS